MNKLLQACEILGLDLNTGVSPVISLNSLQQVYGKPITGNGSILRRDSKPFKFFKLDINKKANKVVSYKFNGYVDVAYEKDKLLSQIKKTRERLVKEQQKVTKRLNELQAIVHNRGNILLYSRNDL